MGVLLAVAMIQTLVAAAPVDEPGPPAPMRHPLDMYVMCLESEVGATYPFPTTIDGAQAAYEAAQAPCQPVRALGMVQAERALANDRSGRDAGQREALIEEWFDRATAFCRLCNLIVQRDIATQKERLAE